MRPPEGIHTPDSPLPTLVERLASHGERVALVDGDRAFTYDELNRAAARVAEVLLEGRPNLDEARVAFLVPPSFEYVATLLGIWRAGGVAVPMAVSHPPAELDYVIRDAEVAVVVADPASAGVLMPLASDFGARGLTTDGAPWRSDDAGGESSDEASATRHPEPGSLRPVAAPLLASSPGEVLQPGACSLDPRRRALMLYTSGTTGRPKGVVTTHANVSAQIASLVEAWEWTDNDRTLLVLPLHHAHGLINVVGSALWSGATCEVLPRFDAESTWARLASGALTVFTAVPTIYHRLASSWEEAPEDVRRARSAGCRRLRLMMSGSAALPVSLLERWRAISGHTLLERYGMTEIGMALSNPLHGVRRPGHVGLPLPGVEAHVVDDGGGVVPEGMAGEVEVRGPTVFLEYWRRPDATHEAFRDGWFRTGDVAVVEDGSYRLLGRKSVDIIKSGGEKISALEIEEVVRRHPAVADCAVVGVADQAWGERVCAAVELAPGATLSLEELSGWARPHLAPAKIPKSLRLVASLPRNAMGKVVKPDVVALFGTGKI